MNPKPNLLNRSLWIAVWMSVSITAAAQSDTAMLPQRTPLVFPSDLDPVKVDSFFRQKNMALEQSVAPAIYFEVFRWYRTCYRYGGGSGSGIDCSGFVQMLVQKFYAQTMPPSSAAMFEACSPLPKNEPLQEGDLVFFKIRKNRISHVGLYLQNNKFAHASVQAGVIISDLSEAYYKKYFYRAARLKVKE